MSTVFQVSLLPVIGVFGQPCMGSFGYAVGSNFDWKCVMRKTDDDNIVDGSYLKSPFAPTSHACIFRTASFSRGTSPLIQEYHFCTDGNSNLERTKVQTFNRHLKVNNLFWPDRSEFARMAARFGATIISFGAVGEDDYAQSCASRMCKRWELSCETCSRKICSACPSVN